MLKRSGQGPYKALAQGVAKGTRDSYGKPGAASSPAVVTDAIVKAIAAKRPRTRYAVGKLARPLILFRKFFGDRAYDKAILSQIG
jgi:hypothetical protein